MTISRDRRTGRAIWLRRSCRLFAVSSCCLFCVRISVSVPRALTESLYIPKKPEFELYLDKQVDQVIGAKLLAVYGDKKYNVLKRPEEGEVRELAEELRVRSLVEPYF